jgi:lipopolysaccharide export system permease protein
MYFGFFALVLVLIYWINRAVKLFDQLLANGQNIFVFLEFTALALPLVIALVLPVASFIASIYVANRLTLESELVVAEATGISPFRLARPVFFFGLFTAAFIAVLAHLLVPMSQVRLVERQGEIAQSITTRFLTEGSFVHPARGITVYIRDITRDGEMRDLFLSDARSPKQRITYTAESALVVRTDDGPRLVMFDGLAQVLHEDGRLTTTGFEDLTYDISALMTGPLFLERKVVHLSTAELLNASPALLAETKSTRAVFLYEAHNRTSQGLFSLVVALVGFSCLLLGGFSRFGLWRQILLAIVAVALLKFLDNALADVARRDAALFWLVYVTPAAGLGLTALILWISARPALFSPRLRRALRQEAS